MADVDFTAKQLTPCELYRFDLSAGGPTLMMNSLERELIYGGYTFQPVPIRRSAIRYHANLEVDRLTVDMGIIAIRVGTDELSVPACIRRGFFREARLRIWACDYEDLASTARMLWDGYCTGPVKYNRGILSLEVGSILDRLNDKFPKVIYSPLCQHVHYSGYGTSFHQGCNLVEDDWKETSIIDTGSTVSRIYSSIFDFSNQAEGYWERGKLYYDGLSRMIAKHCDGYVNLLVPLPVAPVASASVTASPGCDRTGETCAAKFNNYVNFFGFEYIPKPEILYSSLVQ